MPNSTTAAASKTRGEILSVLRTTRSALSLRRRLRRCREKRARRSDTHESTASNFFGANPADAMGRFLPEEEDGDYYEYERNHPPADIDDSDDGKDFLDATRYGGDDGDGPTAVPTSILTYAPNPSAAMTTTATFLSYGVAPLAPPAVGTRRASMGGYYRPTYVSDSAVPGTAGGGRTMNRRGTVPPMGSSFAAVTVGGYLSSTIDNLLVAGHNPAAAGLDIDTSNHNAIHDQDRHHQSIEAYTFPFDQPPSCSSTAGLRDGDDNSNEEKEERHRNFEAMRKAEATRNPRFL